MFHGKINFSHKLLTFSFFLNVKSQIAYLPNQSFHISKHVFNIFLHNFLSVRCVRFREDKLPHEHKNFSIHYSFQSPQEPYCQLVLILLTGAWRHLKVSKTHVENRAQCCLYCIYVSLYIVLLNLDLKWDNSIHFLILKENR